jgi:hypothetical protein
MKVVFVGPKYIDKSCDIVVPDNHITVGSLQSSGLFEVTPLYFEEHSDNSIIEYCCSRKPNMAIFGGLRTSEYVLACLNELKIPIVYLWWDHTSPQNQALAEYLCPLVQLNVVMDMTTPAFSSYPDKYLYMWYPLDRRIFFDPGVTRDIDVCFCGTVLPQFVDRIHYLSLLEKAGYKIYVKTGIYRDNPLKIEEYANLLQRSRIALNFTMLPQYNVHQSKTRTAEILHCGALLLESANEHTPKRFNSSEYVSFSDIDDLKQKIDYYLKHEDERSIIAKNGHNKVHQNYNEVLFWETVVFNLKTAIMYK